MPRKSNLTAQKEDREKLAKLIQQAVDKSGLTHGQVAEKAGIHRSHLSRVLNKEKSLSRDKLSALADVLNLPREVLLEAAGHTVIEEFDLDLRQFGIIRSLGGRKLTVVTDPRFVDSAVFMWIFNTQPFRTLGIDCELLSVDWRDVSQTVATTEYAIGFNNRRAVLKVGDQEVFPVKYWSDLCVYKGYALIARKSDLQPEAPGHELTLEQAKKHLQDLITKYKRKGSKPTIVTIGADTMWRLETPLTEEIKPESFTFQTFADPNFALNRFIGGIGDLFIGGLPQRLEAQEAECVEVLNFKNNPFLASCNGIICPDLMIKEQKPLLAAATSLWFEVISRMKANASFRHRVAQGCIQLIDDLRVSNHSLKIKHFDQVFKSDEYEYFPESPVLLLDKVIQVARTASWEYIKRSLPKDAEKKFKSAEAVLKYVESALNEANRAMMEMLQIEIDKEAYPHLV